MRIKMLNAYVTRQCLRTALVQWAVEITTTLCAIIRMNKRSSQLLCGRNLKTRMALSDQHLSPHPNCAYIQVYDILKITLHITVHVYLHLQLLVSADSTLHQWNLSQLSIYKLYTEHTDLAHKGSNTTQKIDFSTYSAHQKFLIQCKFHKK
jgi:hypothetical protein